MEIRHPTIVRRYFSTLIDYSCVFLMVVIAGALQLEDQALVLVRCLVLIIGLLLYEPLVTAFACTLGQLITRIRVRRNGRPEEKISIGQAFLRYLSKDLLGAISLFTILFSRRQRAIHDLIVKSMMIRTSVPRHPPVPRTA